MSRPRRYTVDDWRRAVFSDPHVSDPTRVLLLFLADHMTADLRVSVKREHLAKALNRSERRIADRLKEAVGDGPGQDKSLRLLDRVVRGQKHVQAVYQGLIPDVLSMTDGGHAEDSQGDATEHPEKSAHGCHAENGQTGSQRDTRGSRLIRDHPSVSGHDRNKRSNEEHQPPEADPSSPADDHSPCVHGMPGGAIPDPWLPGSRLACPACALVPADRKAIS